MYFVLFKIKNFFLYFVFLDLHMLDISHINGITFVDSCLWFSSVSIFFRFIDTAACIRISLTFIVKYVVWIDHLLLPIHQPMDIWVISTFLIIMNNAAVNILYKFLCGSHLHFKRRWSDRKFSDSNDTPFQQCAVQQKSPRLRNTL